MNMSHVSYLIFTMITRSLTSHMLSIFFGSTTDRLLVVVLYRPSRFSAPRALSATLSGAHLSYSYPSETFDPSDIISEGAPYIVCQLLRPTEESGKLHLERRGVPSDLLVGVTADDAVAQGA